MEKCLECGYECNDVFQHVRNKHCLSNLQYKLKYNLYGKCLICNEPIKRRGSKCCCEEHTRIQKSREKFKNRSSNDYVICKECGFYGAILGPHIRDYHKMSINEYHEKHNTTTNDIYSIVELEKMSQKISGDKNPAYQHGGKLSPYSKKFVGYVDLTESEKNNKINSMYINLSDKLTDGSGRLPTQIEYWIKRGVTEEEAIEKISKRQTTFSLEKCIEKYGEVGGSIRWKERQDKWMSNFPKQNFSSISQILFWNLYEKTKNKYKQIYFAQLNQNIQQIEENRNFEYKLDIGQTYCKLDFFIKDINKCIEFDGDYWHGEKRGNKERDENRTKLIEATGIKVLHVTERDFNKDPKSIINKCLSFIHN